MNITKKFSRIAAALTAAVMALAMSAVAVNAQEISPAQNESASESSGNLQRFYFDKNLVNAGLDTGFSEKNDIDKDDPHFGWELGKFNLTGHTRVTEENTDNPVFLKNVGDTLTLWFKLDQDIDRLDGVDGLTISEDANGYDQYFGIKETNFKKGALIIRHSDYRNKDQEPVIYTDYLNSKAKKGSNTKVEIFEEGDYEVALDYEVERKTNFLFITNAEYFNYRVFFKFSVRNGNCMVYPFDASTKEELPNNAITPNGFYLDLAKSRYLDIDIKREVLLNGEDGLTEDVRFNTVAKDGDKYLSEGIYTISVRNKYTGQETQKKIYVGNDNLLKAYMTTGLSIKEIQDKVAKGAQINDDGTIVTVSETALASKENSQNNITELSKALPKASTEPASDINKKETPSDPFGGNLFYLLIACGSIPMIIAVITMIVVFKGGKNKKEKASAGVKATRNSKKKKN